MSDQEEGEVADHRKEDVAVAVSIMKMKMKTLI